MNVSQRLWQTESLNHTITYLKASKRSSFLLCCGKSFRFDWLSLWVFWPQQWETNGFISHSLEHGQGHWLKTAGYYETWCQTIEVEWIEKKAMTIYLKMSIWLPCAGNEKLLLLQICTDTHFQDNTIIFLRWCHYQPTVIPPIHSNCMDNTVQRKSRDLRRAISSPPCFLKGQGYVSVCACSSACKLLFGVMLNQHSFEKPRKKIIEINKRKTNSN